MNDYIYDFVVNIYACVAGSHQHFCLLISVTDAMKRAITQIGFQKVAWCWQVPSVLAQSLQRYACISSVQLGQLISELRPSLPYLLS